MKGMRGVEVLNIQYRAGGRMGCWWRDGFRLKIGSRFGIGNILREYGQRVSVRVLLRLGLG